MMKMMWMKNNESNEMMTMINIEMTSNGKMKKILMTIMKWKILMK